MTEFTPHRVEWTRAKSARFWNSVSAHLDIDDNYWAAMVGGSLVHFVKKQRVDLSGAVLDFGCGFGDLIGHLLRTGVKAQGADFSSESVARVNQRFQGNPNFGGARVIDGVPTDLSAASFDTIFFTETIEHLLDDDLAATIQELRRLLRKGGTLVVTTPNDEPLNHSETICPDCGAIFHRVQHVRSWTGQSLASFMSGHGFTTVNTHLLYLQETPLKSRVFGLAARAFGKKLPHLVYIGHAV